MKRFSFPSTALVVLVCLLSLMNCQPGGDGQTSSQPSTSEEVAEPSNIPAPLVKQKGNVNYRDFGKQVNIYTQRFTEADRKIFEAFQDQLKVNFEVVVEPNGEKLLNIILNRGESSPADVLITDDVSLLWKSIYMGIVMPLTDQTIASNIPSDYRDYSNHWSAIGKYAMVMAYAKDRVKEGSVQTFEQLTQADWKGRVLMGSSGAANKQSLLSSMVAREGAEKASAWLAGIVNNLARPTQGGDREQLDALRDGKGDVALVASHELAAYLSDNKNANIGWAFLRNSEGKVPVNIRGMALAQHAPNVGNAVRLMHFLSSAQTQTQLAASDHTYPANPQAPTPAGLPAWDSFEAENMPLEALGSNNQAALTIIREIGWK
ncbi:MAG: extracellular solute-binding protein [Bacteroidota bacterium]